MDKQFKEYAQFFKALSDPNRLMIVDMLSGGELCACVILEKFRITQPTLSHHMKTLCDCGLVDGRKEGKWVYYSLNEQAVQKYQAIFTALVDTKKNCLCYDYDFASICDCESECE